MNKTILTGILLVWPAATFAADTFDIKPGLWETSSTIEMTGMPAMPSGQAMPQLTDEQLAKIPPAQRAQVEAMMKGRGGAPRTNVGKVCLTRELLAKALSFGQQSNTNGCTQKVTSLSSTRQELHLECSGQMKGSGDVIIERVDSEHAKGNMLVKGEGDHPVTIKASFTTKYLGADCGDVKPLDMESVKK